MATHLAQALTQNRISIDYILSKRNTNARKLAKAIGTKSTGSVKKLFGSDIILVAVNDDAIVSIAKLIQEQGLYKGIIAHTSGSVSSQVLRSTGANYGSFYPLQSFNEHAEIDMRDVPFCICGNNAKTHQTLQSLATQLSPKVYDITDDQRLKLHLAAVFANNFSNHMLTIAEQICSDNQVSFDILKPLLIETFSRLEAQDPSSMQTGPAKRRDRKVISKHKRMLADQPIEKEIYSIITSHIIRTYP